jgi:hypothetical protein
LAPSSLRVRVVEAERGLVPPPDRLGVKQLCPGGEPSVNISQPRIREASSTVIG